MGGSNVARWSAALAFALVLAASPAAIGQSTAPVEDPRRVEFCGPSSMPTDHEAGFVGRATIQGEPWRDVEVGFRVDGEIVSGTSETDAEGFFEAQFRFMEPGKHTVQAVAVTALGPATPAGPSLRPASDPISVFVEDQEPSQPITGEIACYQVYDGPPGVSDDVRVYAFVTGYVAGENLDDPVGAESPVVEGSVRAIAPNNCWGPVQCVPTISEQARGFADAVNDIDTGFAEAVGPFTYEASGRPSLAETCDTLLSVDATASVGTTGGEAVWSDRHEQVELCA